MEGRGGIRALGEPLFFWLFKDCRTAPAASFTAADPPVVSPRGAGGRDLRRYRALGEKKLSLRGSGRFATARRADHLAIFCHARAGFQRCFVAWVAALTHAAIMHRANAAPLHHKKGEARSNGSRCARQRSFSARSSGNPTNRHPRSSI